MAKDHLGAMYTPVAKVTYNDGVVAIELKEDCRPTLQEALQIVEARTKLVQGRLYTTLIVMNGGTLPSREVREYIASLNDDNGRGVAFLCVDDQETMTADFYIRVNNPSSRTKVFSNKKDAIDWLQSQLTKTYHYDY